MKNVLGILTISFYLLSLTSFKPANSEPNELHFNDLTTMNFYRRNDELDFHSIKKLCSYDYCDYLIGDNIKEGLDIFTKNYLKTIEDEETRAILQVKGIRITKIILQN